MSLKQAANRVIFTVNGEKHEVGPDFPPNTTLNSYLRDVCNLKATKNMCFEGGCGSCVVSFSHRNAFTKKVRRFSVNSCLCFLHSCHGWDIETNEGIGNKKTGYHVLQTRLAHFNGTQCGYCSSGMVMNMYSITEGRKVTMQEVENSLGGNICRCTGYRPILDAFKSVAVDAPPSLTFKIRDIEDLYKIRRCSNSKKNCVKGCALIHGNNEECFEDDFVHVDEAGKEMMLNSRFSPVHLHMDSGVKWFKVGKVSDIFDIFSKNRNATYMLIAGNTAQGVYRDQELFQLYIDVKDVEDLVKYSIKSPIEIGGNMTLTDTRNLFNQVAEKDQNYSYLAVLANHIDLIANIPVRNIGTLAGNLMTKYSHTEFPSDLFLILETVGATITIASKNGTETMSIPEFLDIQMNHKIILSITLHPQDKNDYIKTYKIMPRYENAEAYVNAGFRFNIDKNKNGTVLKQPSIVFGGINPYFIHAENTENYLNGKNLFDQKVLQTALHILEMELSPQQVLPGASSEYKRKLACALFYKSVLNLSPRGLPDSFKSGGFELTRPLSRGQQTFQTNEKEWPLTKPIPKIEALAQTSGTAQYVNDMPAIPGQLFGAFVLTTVARGYISNIDATEALNMPGVVSFRKAEDIPGKNNFIVGYTQLYTEEEEIYCSGEVKYAGQTVGLIVAESQMAALEAVSKVKIKYNNIKKPIIKIQDAIDSGDKWRIKTVVPAVELEEQNATHVIEGTFESGYQYHFPLETMQCFCVPTQDGIDLYPSTQFVDLVQLAISQAVKMPENRITIKVRQLGGAFGCKLSRSAQIAVACAEAAISINRPVRISMPLETHMESVGMRYDSLVKYKVGVDDTGKIQYLNADLYEGAGAYFNEKYINEGVRIFKESYDSSNWKVAGLIVKTDIPTTLWCRAPSTCESMAAIEHIMDHIARVTQKDPIDIRLTNLTKKTDTIKTLINDLRISAEYDTRKKNIDDFNKNNRWKKRGISLIPMTYPLILIPNHGAMVSIYEMDGTVAVTHGGIEMGQGINTKVAQVVANAFGISLDMVCVKPTSNFTRPNNFCTGGSVTSVTSAYAAQQCCSELLKRMEPVRKKLSNPTWVELIQNSYKENIPLIAMHTYPYGDDIKPYSVNAVVVTEVELDVLTGQRQVQRVDILEDAGISLSPEIDIGQIEGAFVMGLGFWLQEQIIYDPMTGRNLTNRTWNYKPPLAKDIPIDFRIELRKNSPNPLGFLRSKTTGEPPLCLSCSVLFALRYALDSARRDAALPETFFKMKLPATPENLVLASGQDIKQFLLK